MWATKDQGRRFRVSNLNTELLFHSITMIFFGNRGVHKYKYTEKRNIYIYIYDLGNMHSKVEDKWSFHKNAS